MTTELETNIVAVERVKEYTETPTEVSQMITTGSVYYKNHFWPTMFVCLWSIESEWFEYCIWKFSIIVIKKEDLDNRIRRKLDYLLFRS